MKLTWMPPRSLRREDLVYPQIRHWLVDQGGRIVAGIIEPQKDNPEDSYDARLYLRSTDDEAYFISLEHAQAWCERETTAHLGKRAQMKEQVTAEDVVEAVPQAKN